MTVTSVTNTYADAVTICISQSRDGNCRYVFKRDGSGLFDIRTDAPFEPGYVIVAAACNGALVEVGP